VPADTVKGEDGGAKATVGRAAATPRGKFKVLAEGGISVGMGDKDMSGKKGETVELEGAVIQVLLNEGAIEPA
jgi:hypothetical protein